MYRVLQFRLNMESLEKHVVELEYADTKHNQEIAAWMEQELTRQFDITVTHHVIEAVDRDRVGDRP